MLCIVLSQWSAQLDIAFTPPIYSKYAFHNGVKSILKKHYHFQFQPVMLWMKYISCFRASYVLEHDPWSSQSVAYNRDVLLFKNCHSGCVGKQGVLPNNTCYWMTRGGGVKFIRYC